MHIHSSICKAGNRVFCKIIQLINKLLVSKQYLHYTIALYNLSYALPYVTMIELFLW